MHGQGGLCSFAISASGHGEEFFACGWQCCGWIWCPESAVLLLSCCLVCWAPWEPGQEEVWEGEQS